MCRVSIVMPVYNSETYLSETLESILKQKFDDMEIVCVNDGSSDSSCMILEEYSKKYPFIRVIEQENSTAAVARNRGIREAKGKYVMCLDSDDLFAEGMLEKLWRVSEDNRSDVTVCGYYLYDNESRNITNSDFGFEKSMLTSPSELGEELFQICRPAPWVLFVNLEFLKTNNIGFQNIPNSEDVLYSRMVLARANRIYCLRERFIYYRVNNAVSLSGKYKEPTSFAKAVEGVWKELILIQDFSDSNWKSFYKFANSTIGVNFERLPDESQILYKAFNELKNNTIPTIYNEKYFRECDILNAIYQSEDLVTFLRKIYRNEQTEKLNQSELYRKSRTYRVGQLVCHPLRTILNTFGGK